MWLAGIGLCLAGVGRALPRIEGVVQGPYEGALPIVLRPQVLYALPVPERGFISRVKAHARWCALHKGNTSLACWHQADLAPWQFFGTLLRAQRSGTVKPMELPWLPGQLRFQLRWNAHLLHRVEPHDLRLFHKEAHQRKVCAPGTTWHHYRYYPADRWIPRTGALACFQCTTTKGGRWVVCEGVW